MHGVDPPGWVEVLAGGTAVRVGAELDAVKSCVVGDLCDLRVPHQIQEIAPQRRVVALGGGTLGDLDRAVVHGPHCESDAGIWRLGVPVRSGLDVDVRVGLGVEV